MPSPRLSLCTYTYNDAGFIHDLLRQVPSWQVQPDEIVVVDDGSKQPFAPRIPLPQLRVIRLDQNQGITRAKGAGLSAARGERIFSLDCDTRVAPDWL
ncbi:MAG: glycosyl transferase, partial [Desulfovibrio sp.]|nr:glycosyl transferase [Desulfovibrio sp.]